MQLKGPWTRAEVAAFLASARIPIRLAVNGASGHPLLASLWFLADGDTIWCTTQRDSRIVAALARDPRCAFEVTTGSGCNQSNLCVAPEFTAVSPATSWLRPDP